jgi:hypothetical protein
MIIGLIYLYFTLALSIFNNFPKVILNHNLEKINGPNAKVIKYKKNYFSLESDIKKNENSLKS